MRPPDDLISRISCSIDVCTFQLKVIRDKISQNVVRCETENKFLEKDDFMWDSIPMDAIKNIDEREKKMIEEISR
jgi:hypothetical protein